MVRLLPYPRYPAAEDPTRRRAKAQRQGNHWRVLAGLLGQSNASRRPSPASGSISACAPLIGKQLAVIADARLSSRPTSSAIAERLLSISGEDSITIDRKFPAWTGRLTTRLQS